MRRVPFVLLPMLCALAAPAAAQFSDSYNFLKAVRDRDGAKVTELVEVPGSVLIDTRDRETGEAALHIVARRRDPVWLNFLLAKNARPDIKDNAGNTPLMVATQIGFVDGVKLLLAAKARVNDANNSGETPLIRAVQLRNIELVRVLLAAGASRDQTDTLAGLSALDYARRDARAAAIVKILEEEARKPASAATVGPNR